MSRESRKREIQLRIKQRQVEAAELRNRLDDLVLEQAELARLVVEVRDLEARIREQEAAA